MNGDWDGFVECVKQWAYQHQGIFDQIIIEKNKAGVAMLFVALFIPPQGEISGSALGAVGEVFLLAGAILGLDSYTTFKMKNLIQQTIGNEKEIKADETNKE